MEIKGIDVSSYQGKPDWAKVKKAGIKFAILRIAQRSGIDSSFEHNYNGCWQNAIPMGGYKYSYALTTAQAKAEADQVLEVMKGRRMDFPIFYDLEWAQQRSLRRSEIIAIARTFLRRIEDAGYRVGIYCNLDWYRNVLDTGALKYEYWIASYPYNDTGRLVESLRPSVGVGWQYSSKGRVSGISGNVDLDVFYKDYYDKKDDARKRRRLFVGKVTASVLNVRTWAGTEYPQLPAYPILKKDNLVDVMDFTQKSSSGEKWYYIRIKKGDGYVYGFVSARYIERT